MNDLDLNPAGAHRQLAEAMSALPAWDIHFDGHSRALRARHPSYPTTGLVIEASTAAELVQRCGAVRCS